MLFGEGDSLYEPPVSFFLSSQCDIHKLLHNQYLQRNGKYLIHSLSWWLCGCISHVDTNHSHVMSPFWGK